ncbi:uncharacterized protein CLUP02_01317, partial [Colletotrichum lupini]
HCRRRFKCSLPFSVLLTSCVLSPLPSSRLSARKGHLLCVRGIAHQGAFLAGTAGCEAPWVGVDKDVMAAWPSIFNSSGDFFRPPCHRLSVSTHCWPVTPAHQAKPNGTSFCGQTPSRQRWPTFCCSETPLGMAARSHRDHPSTLAQTQTMPIRSVSVLALVLFITRCHLLGVRISCFNGDMCRSAIPPQRLG